jgi:SAM-dependent methyltransferase
MQSEQFELHADIEQRHWWFVARRRIMRQLVEQVLPPSPESVVVDVGCGTGANLAALAEAYDCVGIDASAEAVELARGRFPGVRFLAGRAPDDLGDLAARARLFMLMDVLEHVDDDFAMLSDLLAAARPGAHFLLSVPADESLWSEHDESFGHYRRYDRARLEQLWAGLPVTTLLVSHFNTRLLPLIRAVRWRNRRRGQAAGLGGTDFWLPTPPLNSLLQGIFAGESRRLLRSLAGRRDRGYTAGASLIAVLRREEGSIDVRRKPADLPPDRRLAPCATA